MAWHHPVDHADAPSQGSAAAPPAGGHDLLERRLRTQEDERNEGDEERSGHQDHGNRTVSKFDHDNVTSRSCTRRSPLPTYRHQGMTGSSAVDILGGCLSAHSVLAADVRAIGELLSELLISAAPDLRNASGLLETHLACA